VHRPRRGGGVAGLSVCRWHGTRLVVGQCRRIAKALDGGETALAQIFGLRIPVADLDSGSLNRLVTAARFIKANFNPDEPRIPAGQPGGGEWTPGGAAEAPAPVPSVAESDGAASPERGGRAEPSLIPAQVTIPWDLPTDIPWELPGAPTEITPIPFDFPGAERKRPPLPTNLFPVTPNVPKSGPRHTTTAIECGGKENSGQAIPGREGICGAAFLGRSRRDAAGT